jgi:chromosome partitioning protein
MKTLALANQKGGVGKSAVACILAHYAVRQGQRVLAIDLDHQGNMTKPLQKSGGAQSTSMSSSRLFEMRWEHLQKQVGPVPEGSLVLVPSDADKLMLLERQGGRHEEFATNFRDFLLAQSKHFDLCVIDTNPFPDIRVLSALIASTHVLSPIQLNQEAIDGIGALRNHPRVGLQKIQATLNPNVALIGLLPNLVEATPYQRGNLRDIVMKYPGLLIPTQDPQKPWAYLPKRSVIAETQGSGEVLWTVKKSAARDTWRDIEPAFVAIAKRLDLKPRQIES